MLPCRTLNMRKTQRWLTAGAVSAVMLLTLLTACRPPDSATPKNDDATPTAPVSDVQPSVEDHHAPGAPRGEGPASRDDVAPGETTDAPRAGGPDLDDLVFDESEDDDLAADMPLFDLYGPEPWLLGEPLVDSAENLIRLHPREAVWITPDRRGVVFQGIIVQRRALLEMFVCRRGSTEHESVIAADVTPQLIQAGLIATGAEPGSPVVFYPEYRAATGPIIDVMVSWKDENGAVQTARGQDWVFNVETQEAMSSHWVFAGSQVASTEVPGFSSFLADRTGNIITVANFPDAVLDLAMESSSSDADRIFAAYSQRVPARGTPVTVVLTPRAAATPGARNRDSSGPPVP